jgi:hypothetical protein
MVIGRKLFGSYLFPLFLNIGLMLPINHIKNKKLFCAFVDFEKAFDKVWREALWYKLTMLSTHLHLLTAGKILNHLEKLKTKTGISSHPV